MVFLSLTGDGYIIIIIVAWSLEGVFPRWVSVVLASPKRVWLSSYEVYVSLWLGSHRIGRIVNPLVKSVPPPPLPQATSRLHHLLSPRLCTYASRISIPVVV